MNIVKSRMNERAATVRWLLLFDGALSKEWIKGCRKRMRSLV